MAKKVFLSHSSTHSTKTTEVHQLLSGYGADKLDFFRSELIPPGAMWFKKLHHELMQADVLIVLLFQSDIDWDWCNYEAGLFVGSKPATDADGSLVVLRSEGVSVPKPLTHYQNVTVGRKSPEQVDAFLRRLFECDSTNPINKELSKSPAILQGVRNRLVELFAPEHQPVYTAFDQRISLRFSKQQLAQLQQSGTVPNEVVVRGEYGALQLFGFDPPIGAVAWGEVCAALSRAGESEAAKEALAAWPRQLGRILRVASEFVKGAYGYRLSDGLPLFFEPLNHVTYRPSLYERFWYPEDEAAEFRINFTRLPDELSKRPAAKLAIISHLLDLCRMFRWGVLESETFKPINDGSAEHWTESAKRELLDRLDMAFDNLRCDFLNRGFREDQIARAFDSKAAFVRSDASRVSELLQVGHDLSKSFSEARAIADIRKTQEVLSGYSAINWELFRIVLRHYRRHVDRLPR